MLNLTITLQPAWFDTFLANARNTHHERVNINNPLMASFWRLNRISVVGSDFSSEKLYRTIGLFFKCHPQQVGLFSNLINPVDCARRSLGEDGRMHANT